MSEKLFFDNKVVTVPSEYIEELEKKAKDCDYYKGKVAGLEYVIDTIENILKSKGVE